ncbi:MAG: type II toxin-antitoxin system VapC family toxin [Burkholderiales bacterium]|nr:type II toxin-antitoxin system VapC family toxin [Phycisphaerae bacterium]
MNLYLDTSALIKRYCFEDGSMFLSRVLAPAAIRGSSVLLYAEVAAALHRKVREGMLPADFGFQWRQFEADYAGLSTIAIDMSLLAAVPDLCARHPLRSADAIHLASALACQSRTSAVTFVAADQRLLAAAAAEGMAIIDVSHDAKDGL